MDQDPGIELGWGFYLIIVPLVLSILLEWVVKPGIIKLTDTVEAFKRRLIAQDKKIENIKKWIKRF